MKTLQDKIDVISEEYLDMEDDTYMMKTALDKAIQELREEVEKQIASYIAIKILNQPKDFEYYEGRIASYQKVLSLIGEKK